MKKHSKKIVSYDSNNLPKDKKTDWKRVDAMSEKELKYNALTDKDTMIIDEKFFKKAKLVKK